LKSEVDLGQTGHAAKAQRTTELIPSGQITLEGELNVPARATGVVLFAHGSGSSRHSPRNQFVARTIREAGIGTLLFDLLTREEEAVDISTRHLRFDIGLLAKRLIDANNWLKKKADTSHLRVGYFGASTGGGAALVAAAELGEEIGAVVSRGGRPDLAGDALAKVKSPTLLIVGGLDYAVIRMNEDAYRQLRCEKELKIVPGATHLFEEPGALEEVARLAAEWFQRHLGAAAAG
jgi:putative phosphoribosyl transferase